MFFTNIGPFSIKPVIFLKNGRFNRKNCLFPFYPLALPHTFYAQQYDHSTQARQVGFDHDSD